MPTYALLGYPLSHSFSRKYFTDKFDRMGLAKTHRYLNFEIPRIEDFAERRAAHPDLNGCNVTIPYKQSIIPLLDSIDPAAARIGAVNTIKFTGHGTRGFNTDYIGFRDDLLAQLTARGRSTKLQGQAALILGTGGASRAVREALVDLGVRPQLVSRRAGPDVITYGDIDCGLLEDYSLLINTTPLGTYPNTETAPPLPYTCLSDRHFCYDLVYNPATTEFMRRAGAQGAATANGLGMLHLQAEASWKIWTGE